MGVIDLPDFAKVDFAPILNWVFSGVTDMIASNLPLVIGVSLGISAMLSVVGYAKRTGSAAFH